MPLGTELGPAAQLTHELNPLAGQGDLSLQTSGTIWLPMILSAQLAPSLFSPLGMLGVCFTIKNNLCFRNTNSPFS